MKRFVPISKHHVKDIKHQSKNNKNNQVFKLGMARHSRRHGKEAYHEGDDARHTEIHKPPQKRFQSIPMIRNVGQHMFQQRDGQKDQDQNAAHKDFNIDPDLGIGECASQIIGDVSCANHHHHTQIIHVAKQRHFHLYISLSIACIT